MGASLSWGSVVVVVVLMAAHQLADDHTQPDQGGKAEAGREQADQGLSVAARCGGRLVGRGNPDGAQGRR